MAKMVLGFCVVRTEVAEPRIFHESKVEKNSKNVKLENEELRKWKRDEIKSELEIENQSLKTTFNISWGGLGSVVLFKLLMPLARVRLPRFLSAIAYNGEAIKNDKIDHIWSSLSSKYVKRFFEQNSMQ